MQLNIDVLPAPFGPINAVIEPGSTPNDTSLMAFRPPKESDSPSTSRRAGFIGARIDTPRQTPVRRLSGRVRQTGSLLLPSPCSRSLPAHEGHLQERSSRRELRNYPFDALVYVATGALEPSLPVADVTEHPDA